MFLFWLKTSYSQFLWPGYAAIIVTVPDEHEELWTLCIKETF